MKIAIAALTLLALCGCKDAAICNDAEWNYAYSLGQYDGFNQMTYNTGWNNKMRSLILKVVWADVVEKRQTRDDCRRWPF